MSEQQAPKSIDIMEKAGQWRAKYYSSDPPQIRPEVREVFEKYSKIPSDEVDAHLERIVHPQSQCYLHTISTNTSYQREKAWKIHPYPCIGQWRFLDLAIGQHSAYPEVLERMRTGEQVFLDLGCAFAQDIRKLVCDGVDSSKCHGSDLRLNFIDLGYELFRDKETLKSRFFEGDIFDADSALKEMHGIVDIICASSFFHLFNWDEQKQAAVQTAKLMKPQAGSLLIGRQVGSSEPGEKGRSGGKGTRYRHDLETWRKMWKEVGDEVGVEFQVDGTFKPVPKAMEALAEIGDSVLEFTIRRAQ